MSAIDAIFSFITEGSLLGLPPAIFMAAPFIIGLILGFLIKKSIKLVIVGLIIGGGALFFGILNMEEIKYYLQRIGKYAPELIQLAALVLGILPLGLGFAVGLIVGLKYG